ncbi:MAG: diguanylate cyclase, partial [Planctomycetaceae bacterium]|nr:diguanylate cyclase [Planctomycetaceae bacterium]
MDPSHTSASLDAVQPLPAGEMPLPAADIVGWDHVPDLLERLESLSAEELQAPPRAAAALSSRAEPRVNQLIQVRLGIASSLHAALHAKDPATAAHSYRVAIYCSNWARLRSQAPAECDALEVAALLHDVGKIGVPDHVLLKPGSLWHDEAVVMERHRAVGLEILRSCCASDAVLDIVAHTPDWYDGSRSDSGLVREQLPLGARMLAIANAFDAMTTDQVYRRALSRERAIAELFRCAGTQFDPELVQEFAAHDCWDTDKLVHEVGQQWLRALGPAEPNELWRLHTPESKTLQPVDEIFRQALPEQISDAVIFIDDQLHVLLWNRGAERLTGISGASMRGRRWLPSAIVMRDERRHPIADEDCPVAHAIQTGQPWVRRVQIKGRGRRRVGVDAHVTPVSTPDGRIEGATLVMHDVSPEISLESRCQSLHELATKDPLTEVANRAEFDRVLAMFVVVHLEQQRPCSLIIGDIDHFKRVNDTFGHQAGDEVLKFVARILRNSCRPGDLVARYGGEEFVMLCADCDNMAATRRAEEIRRKIGAKPHSVLDNDVVTISFGVTEIQPGDTPETMLRRADRALYQAKDHGRDSVCQLGTGLLAALDLSAAAAGHDGVAPAPGARLPQAAAPPLASVAEDDPSQILAADLVAWTPLVVAMQKLQGFAADHHAEAM